MRCRVRINLNRFRNAARLAAGISAQFQASSRAKNTEQQQWRNTTRIASKKQAHDQPPSRLSREKGRRKIAPPSIALETEPCLELNHPPRQSIQRSAKLAGVDDVRRRARWRERLKIQNVEGIEEVGAQLEFGSLAEQSHLRKVEILAER